MDDKILDQQLQKALELHDEGKSYTDIRNHFKEELDEDMIAYLIRLVDEFELEDSRIKEEIKKAKFKMYVGLIAFGISALIIYSFYTYDSLSGTMSLLAYLPMVFSLYLLWRGYKDEIALKKIEPEIDDVKFRMKRRRRR